MAKIKNDRAIGARVAGNIFAGILLTAGMLPAASVADYIETSASCSNGTGNPGCDSAGAGSDYGFTFRIAETVAEELAPGTAPDHDGHADTSRIFHATLLNTSTAGTGENGNDPVIDLLAFNLNATLGTDFTIDLISPNWTFAAASGGVKFDYVGDTQTSALKLDAGETLVFDVKFSNSYTLPSDPFTLWTDTGAVKGSGIGGGDDVGQVAVSFQALGGGASDLLAADWTGGGGGGGGGGSVPVPAPLLLLGLGALFLGLRRAARR